MVLGVGIDSVEIARFAHWHTYDQKKLLRIFSQSEIEYCLSVPAKRAERFAVRFAAREALYKACSSMQPHHKIPFLTFCKAVTITKENQIPSALIDIQAIDLSSRKIFISLTHTATSATAFAIIEAITN